MKRIIAAAVATASLVGTAALTDIELAAGLNDLPTPSRAVVCRVVSTNLSGTVTAKRVTPYVHEWTDTVVITNETRHLAYSNVVVKVTNDVVSVWRTNLFMNGRSDIISNLVASAVNSTPAYLPEWTNILITTNRVEATSVSNVAYLATGDIRVTIQDIRRSKALAWTNDVFSATLASGYLATNLSSVIFLPGERLLLGGTAIEGGSARIVLED